MSKTPPPDPASTTYKGLALLGIDSQYPALTQLQSIISPDHFIAAARHSSDIPLPSPARLSEPIDSSAQQQSPPPPPPPAESTEKRVLLDFLYASSSGVGYGQDLGPGRLGAREVAVADAPGAFTFAIDRFDLSGGSFALAARFRVDEWAVVESDDGHAERLAVSYSPLLCDWVKPRSFLVEVTSQGPRVELRRSVPVWEANTPDDKRLLVKAAPSPDAPQSVKPGEWHTLAVRFVRGSGTVTLWSDDVKVGEETTSQPHGVQRTNHPELFIGWQQETALRFRGAIEHLKVVAGGHSDDEVATLIASVRPQGSANGASPVGKSPRGALVVQRAGPSAMLSNGRSPSKPHTLFDLGQGNAFQNVAGVPICDAELRALFATYDADGSGFISRDEFKKEFQTFESFGLELSDREVERLFNRFDTRRDGKLDFTEFALLMLQRSKM